MKKKVVSLVTVLTMVAALCVGCGGGTKELKMGDKVKDGDTVSVVGTIEEVPYIEDSRHFDFYFYDCWDAIGPCYCIEEIDLNGFDTKGLSDEELEGKKVEIEMKVNEFIGADYDKCETMMEAIDAYYLSAEAGMDIEVISAEIVE